MNLHNDRDAFSALISSIHEKTNLREDILEKDYYVVLFLEELAQMQSEGLPAYFRGGTALYKALKTMNRFSEYIDLSVDTRNCSRTQNDKLLEKATKKYKSLLRRPELGRTNRSEVIAIYSYEPIVKYSTDDVLNRFGTIMVEATSFTISEPVEKMEVSTLLYDFADEEAKIILRERFDVKPFMITTMTLERIFVDKLFAAEAYFRKAKEEKRALEAAKHIYDIVVMYEHPRIEALFNNDILLGDLLKIRMLEEQNRLDGIPDIYPSEFVFFTGLSHNKGIKEAYNRMEKIYIFDASDKIDFIKLSSIVELIGERLGNNPVWEKLQKPRF